MDSGCGYDYKQEMKHFKLSKLVIFLLAGLSLSPPALSQEASERLCAASLSDLSWVLHDEGQYPRLNSDRSGKALHGLQCREVEIIAWFRANAWTYRKSVSPSGEVFGHGARSYRADRSLVFCLPRRFPFRWLTNGCIAQASVSLFDGQITQLTAGPAI